MTPRKDAGIVLITVLLYLSVLILIASSVFNTSLLQFKMTQYFQDSDKAFQQAESALVQGQSVIERNRLLGRGRSSDGGEYEFERLSTVQCGMLFYRVGARGVFQRAVKRLESIVLLPVYDEQCPDAGGTHKRRVLWRDEFTK